MKRARTLCELYSFSGFRAAAQLKGVFGDPDVRVVRLRRKKRLYYTSHTQPHRKGVI